MHKTLYWLLILLMLSACSRGPRAEQSLAQTTAPTQAVDPIEAAEAVPATEAAELGHGMGAAGMPAAHMPAARTPAAHAPVEQAAMPVTEHSHVADGPHIETAPGGAPTETERQQAAEIRAAAKAAFEKYRDYREALKDGYVIFAEEVPQDVYHFINYRQSMRNHGVVDPLRPTALLYRKVGDGWEWYGVMYSAPYETAPEGLDAIYPRSLGEWHAHVNICFPPNAGNWLNDPGAAMSDAQFGFEGSIATRRECQAAGGRFHPDVLGWMVHVDLRS